MTANEMRNMFKEFYDGASSMEMGFDDTEVSRFLNVGQQLIMEKKLFGNLNAQKQGFEVGSKRDTELIELKREAYMYRHPETNVPMMVVNDGTPSPTTWAESFLDDAVIIDLPDDFLYYQRDLVDISLNGVVYKNVRVESANEDTLVNDLTNAFKKPYRRKVLRSSHNRDGARRTKIYLSRGGSLKLYRLTYIKQPVTIVVDILNPANQIDCELEDAIHLSIVKMAVQVALGSVGAQKYQIAINENNID